MDLQNAGNDSDSSSTPFREGRTLSMGDIYAMWDSDEFEEDAAAETATKSTDNVVCHTLSATPAARKRKSRRTTQRKPPARIVFQSSIYVAPGRWLLGDNKFGKISTKLILKDPSRLVDSGRVYTLLINHPELENSYLKYYCQCSKMLIMFLQKDAAPEIREEAGIHADSCRLTDLGLLLLEEGDNWVAFDGKFRDPRPHRLEGTPAQVRREKEMQQKTAVSRSKTPSLPDIGPNGRASGQSLSPGPSPPGFVALTRVPAAPAPAAPPQPADPPTAKLTTFRSQLKRFNDAKTELFVKTTPNTGYKYGKTENPKIFKCVNCPALAFLHANKHRQTYVKTSAVHEPPCQLLDYLAFTAESKKSLPKYLKKRRRAAGHTLGAGEDFLGSNSVQNLEDSAACVRTTELLRKKIRLDGSETTFNESPFIVDLTRNSPSTRLDDIIAARSEAVKTAGKTAKNTENINEKRTSAHPLMFYRPSELWLSDCCRKLHLDGSRLDEAYDVWNRLRKVDLDAPQFPEVGQVKTFASGFGLVSCLFTGADSAVETVKESVNRCFFNRYREMDPEMTFETAVRVMNEEDMGRFHWRSLSILLGCAVVVFDYGARKKQVYRAKVEGQCPAVVVGLKFDEYFLFLK